jgi:hypothetical protein
MEIKPNYVTFEQAKLLKEKGLVVKSDRYWVKMTEDSYTDMTDWRLEDLDSDIGIGGNLVITKYQQWQVVEFLRINYGIWVGVTMYINHDGRFYSANIQNNDNKHQSFNGHKSPQEAYSAAFDHILNNNLI